MCKADADQANAQYGIDNFSSYALTHHSHTVLSF